MYNTVCGTSKSISCSRTGFSFLWIADSPKYFSMDTLIINTYGPGMCKDIKWG